MHSLWWLHILTLPALFSTYEIRPTKMISVFSSQLAWTPHNSFKFDVKYRLDMYMTELSIILTKGVDVHPDNVPLKFSISSAYKSLKLEQVKNKVVENFKIVWTPLFEIGVGEVTMYSFDDEVRVILDGSLVGTAKIAPNSSDIMYMHIQCPQRLKYVKVTNV